MKLLLDTHVFLWLVTGDERLSAKVRDQIIDPANQAYLSVASLWECIVKSQIGKLQLPKTAERFIVVQRIRHQIDSLDIDETSGLALAQLPPLHRDPFDRILIAQAIAHQMTLLTVDPAVLAYNVGAIVRA